MLRHLLGDTDESLQQWREQILDTTPHELRAFADVLDQVAQHGSVVVLGSPEAVGAANEERGGWLQVTPVM